MGTGIVMMLMLHALNDVYKLLAVAVALYFPLVMLTWLAIDKLRRPTRDTTMDVRRRSPSSVSNLPSAAARGGLHQ